MDERETRARGEESGAGGASDRAGRSGRTRRRDPRPPPHVPRQRRQPEPTATRCVRMQVAIPREWPVASRTGVAVARLMVVDRRGEERLVCDGLHDGPHFWPEDEPAPPIWDDALDVSLAAPGQPASADDAAAGTAPHDEPAAGASSEIDA